MFKTITRLVMAAALLVGSAQAQYRSETVASTSNPGFVADVSGAAFSSNSVIGYVARYGGFTFGSGTVVSVPHFNANTISYSYGSVTFHLSPVGVSWFIWCYGWGTADLTVS